MYIIYLILIASWYFLHRTWVMWRVVDLSDAGSLWQSGVHTTEEERKPNCTWGTYTQQTVCQTFHAWWSWMWGSTVVSQMSAMQVCQGIGALTNIFTFNCKRYHVMFKTTTGKQLTGLAFACQSTALIMSCLKWLNALEANNSTNNNVKQSYIVRDQITKCIDIVGIVYKTTVTLGKLQTLPIKCRKFFLMYICMYYFECFATKAASLELVTSLLSLTVSF